MRAPQASALTASRHSPRTYPRPILVPLASCTAAHPLPTDDGSNPEVPGSASGSAPMSPLPDRATRLQQARDAADQRRRELGLPDPPDEVDVPRGTRKTRKASWGTGVQ